MFKESDISYIRNRGSILKEVNKQIENFKTGFPFLNLHSAATPEDGILVSSQNDISEITDFYDSQTAKKKIVKFVPASGAASRMFKLLYSTLEISSDAEKVQNAIRESDGLQAIGTFFSRIKDFAFFDDLNEVLNQQGKSIGSCMDEKDYSSILSSLLENDGLNYGASPKGLLKFHKYDDKNRTPVMEHLAEGAMYAESANKTVNIHFTVSPEHKEKFKSHITEIKAGFEKTFDVRYNISFSEQKAFTDTIAVDLSNEPFRNSDSSLLFRPAGHGALIANLNDIDADIIFVKNIDNVVPDKIKEDTVTYKKVLAGLLMQYQTKIFSYLEKLDDHPDKTVVDEIMIFLEQKLKIKDIPIFSSEEETISFIRKELNRPLRMCGMVKNEGEPGGGPFYAKNPDGTTSLQIAESSQIDFGIDSQKDIASKATHFNPVDLVCAVKNYKGEKFDLNNFVDPETGFISQKSKDGKELKAQELPGLWNGAMSDWNTIFVEVPISTFNPVKTVNDLLRPQHQ